MIPYITALIAALTGTALGQLNFKLFFVRNKQGKYLLFALLFFCTVPLCSYIALHRLTIGLVYMCTAVTQLVVLGLSYFVLKEKLNRHHAIALLLILTGIVVYAW